MLHLDNDTLIWSISTSWLHWLKLVPDTLTPFKDILISVIAYLFTFFFFCDLLARRLYQKHVTVSLQYIGNPILALLTWSHQQDIAHMIISTDNLVTCQHYLGKKGERMLSSTNLQSGHRLTCLWCSHANLTHSAFAPKVLIVRVTNMPTWWCHRCDNLVKNNPIKCFLSWSNLWRKEPKVTPWMGRMVEWKVSLMQTNCIRFGGKNSIWSSWFIAFLFASFSNRVIFS